MVKNVPARQEVWFQSLSQEDHREEEEGNLLEYSCLENFMDRGAWKATVYGITKKWTQLKQLSKQAGMQRRGRSDRQGPQGRRWQIRVMLPQLQDVRKPQKLQETNEESPPRAFRSWVALQVLWFWTFCLYSCEKINFCCFKLRLVITSLGKKYTKPSTLLKCII